MKKILAATTVLLISFSLMSMNVYAHSGRTDKNGCHMDKKAGTRHCH